MSTATYQKDGLGWRLSQGQQRFGEWWERLTDRISFDPPELPQFESPLWETIAKTIFWLTIVALVLWLGWLLWSLLSPYLFRLANPKEVHSGNLKAVAAQERAAAEWLARSRELQQKGNYRQACICLYRAMLQRLHDSGTAIHQPSRTDGEYLQIIQSLPRPHPYQTLLITHQQLCFSDTEATPSLCDRCQQAYEEL